MHSGPIFVAFLVFAVIAAFGTAAGAEDWPKGKWDEKLAEPYEAWKPIKDALSELAARAGAEVSFAEESKATFQVPLPAGLTLKEAVQKAAATCALEASWDGNRVVVRKGTRVASWLELAGTGPSVAIVEGNVRGLYLPPHRDANRPTPWVWYAPKGWGPYHAWIAKRLFEQGIALASVNVGESQGNPAGRAIFTSFYELAVAKHGMARKPVLLPQSRGGLMLYNWAAEHPDCVAAIGGIYTVCDLRSYPGMKTAAAAYGMSEAELTAVLPQHNPIDRLAPLAKAGIPIFHVHGDKDGTVPLEKNSGELARRYKALGGQAEVLVIPGRGHEAGEGGREFFQCKQLVDFLIRHAKAGTSPGASQPISSPAAPPPKN